MSRADPASHGQGQKRERRPNEKGYRERGTHLRAQAVLVDEGERRPPIAVAVPIIPDATPPTTHIRSCKVTLELIEPTITAATTRLPSNTQRYSSGTNERSPTPPNVRSRRPRSTYARSGTSMARLSLVAMATRERHHEQVPRAGRASGRNSVNAGTTTKAKPKPTAPCTTAPSTTATNKNKELRLTISPLLGRA